MSYVVDIIRADEIEVGMKVWIRTKGFREINAVWKHEFSHPVASVVVAWGPKEILPSGAAFRLDEEVLKIHDEEGK